MPLCNLLYRTEKRERRREAKAQVAARLDKAIESELLKRLQAGTYGDIYNFPLKSYEKVMIMCCLLEVKLLSICQLSI